MLSHYKGVIWYTGDDVVTRRPGRGARQRRPARVRRDARDAGLHGRGRPRRLLGQDGRHAVHGAGVGTQYYDPKDEAVCRIGGVANPALDSRRCLPLRGSVFGGDLINDVLQYWFGGMVQIAGDGQTGTTPYALNGIGNPFEGSLVVADGSADGGHRHVVVRDDERHPARRRVPAVRQQRLGALGEAGRAVRPALGQQVRLLAAGRRELQAAHP